LLIQNTEIIEFIAELGKPANDEPEQFCLRSLMVVIFFGRRLDDLMWKAPRARGVSIFIGWHLCFPVVEVEVTVASVWAGSIAAARFERISTASGDVRCWEWFASL
jgi:hypothetical protein